MKCRLAPKIAREQFGWQAVALGRILVLPEERTARRAIERHSAAIDASLPARSRAIRSWLRQPVGKIGGVWFLSDGEPANVTRNPSAIRRVRPRVRSLDAPIRSDGAATSRVDTATPRVDTATSRVTRAD